MWNSWIAISLTAPVQAENWKGEQCWPCLVASPVVRNVCGSEWIGNEYILNTYRTATIASYICQIQNEIVRSLPSTANNIITDLSKLQPQTVQIKKREKKWKLKRSFCNYSSLCSRAQCWPSTLSHLVELRLVLAHYPCTHSIPLNNRVSRFSPGHASVHSSSLI